MNRKHNGFTLIEMLVVIGIIGFLASALTIASVGLKQRAKIEKANALVLKLDTGAEAYFAKFQGYPGNYAKGAAPSIDDTVTLYEYLAKPLKAVEGFEVSAKVRDLPPFLEITASEIAGNPTIPFNASIIDPWMRAINYTLPGLTHGSYYMDMSKRFDIRSLGPEPTVGTAFEPGDDVTNWSFNRK